MAVFGYLLSFQNYSIHRTVKLHPGFFLASNLAKISLPSDRQKILLETSYQHVNNHSCRPFPIQADYKRREDKRSMTPDSLHLTQISSI